MTSKIIHNAQTTTNDTVMDQTLHCIEDEGMYASFKLIINKGKDSACGLLDRSALGPDILPEYKLRLAVRSASQRIPLYSTQWVNTEKECRDIYENALSSLENELKNMLRALSMWDCEDPDELAIEAMESELMCSGYSTVSLATVMTKAYRKKDGAQDTAIILRIPFTTKDVRLEFAYILFEQERNMDDYSFNTDEHGLDVLSLVRDLYLAIHDARLGLNK